MKTYHARKVGLGWQQEQVVDTVHDVLWLNILFRFVLGTDRDGSIHANVCDAFHNLCRLFLVFRNVVLKDEIASKWQNEVLQDINWGFSAKKEHKIAKQLPLVFSCLRTLFHGNDLWRFLELNIDINFFLCSLVEELASIALHLSHLSTLVELSVNGKIAFGHWVG